MTITDCADRVLALNRDEGIPVRDAIHTIAQSEHVSARLIAQALNRRSQHVRKYGKLLLQPKTTVRDAKPSEEELRWDHARRIRRLHVCAKIHEMELLRGFHIAGHEDDI